MRLKVGNEWHEQDAGIDVVVKGQLPVIVVDGRQDLFGKDGVETDKKGGADTKGSSNHGEVDLSLGSHKETADDNEQTEDGSERGRASENELAQSNVEDNGQGSSDIVEGDLDVSQT